MAEAENTADHFQHREVRPEYLEKLKLLVAAKGKAYASVEELVRDTGR